MGITGGKICCCCCCCRKRSLVLVALPIFAWILAMVIPAATDKVISAERRFPALPSSTPKPTEDAGPWPASMHHAASLSCTNCVASSLSNRPVARARVSWRRLWPTCGQSSWDQRSFRVRMTKKKGCLRFNYVFYPRDSSTPPTTTSPPLSSVANDGWHWKLAIKKIYSALVFYCPIKYNLYKHNRVCNGLSRVIPQTV